MLAILQSLRMQTTRLCFSGVTSDLGRFGSAFVLCLSWGGLKEVFLSKGNAFGKSSAFSTVLIWRLKKMKVLKIIARGVMEAGTCSSGSMCCRGCMVQSLELSSCRTRAHGAWSLWYQVIFSSFIPLSCFPIPACEEMSLVKSVMFWGEVSYPCQCVLTLHAGVQVLSAVLCCSSAETVWVVGCFRWFSPRLWWWGDAELVNDPRSLWSSWIRRLINVLHWVWCCIQL